MDNMKKFIDLFVSNFQPEPEIINGGNMCLWKNTTGIVSCLFFDNNIVAYFTMDFIDTKRFKFDGTADSIPEELMDAIFEVNGFIGGAHEQRYPELQSR